MVLGIMKNEALVVDEWIDHYFEQGADHIVLIDNGSDDRSFEIAKSRVQEGRVSCVQWTQRWNQMGHYWRAIKLLKLRRRFEWILIADLDEFWFVKAGGRLADYLAQLSKKIDLIYVQWRIFGSNGLENQPSSVRKSFTRCHKSLTRFENTKWLCRSRKLPHYRSFKLHKVYSVNSARVSFENENLQLNHYMIQSREYFKNAKMSRGDACNPDADEIKNWSYFEQIDSAATCEDFLLRDQVIAREHNRSK